MERLRGKNLWIWWRRNEGRNDIISGIGRIIRWRVWWYGAGQKYLGHSTHLNERVMCLKSNKGLHIKHL